jgi:hypothetical protein
MKDFSRPKRVVIVALALLLCGLAIYLVSTHYVKAYSDPAGWLGRAEHLREGSPVTSRAPVYPAFLVAALEVTGPVYIFLSNLPLLILLVALVYLLTVRSHSGGHSRDGPAGSEAAVAGFAAAAILIMVNSDLLLELLNPFREALAFSLLLGGLVLSLDYFETRRLRLLLPAGLLLGVSVGVRETCVLVLPALGLLYLYTLFTDRGRPHLRALLLFAAGLAVGLLPLLMQNFLHSGKFWVPSYAAAKLVLKDGDVLKPRDVPVPGMRVRHFFTTGRDTLLFFPENYGWAGGILFILGFVRSIHKRYMPVLLLLVPGAIISLIFYSFYWYLKARYLFVISLFIVPVMGIGLAWVAGTTLAAFGRKRMEAVTVLLLLFATLGMLAKESVTRAPRFKVWEMTPFRESVESHLEPPYAFASKRAHFRQIFSIVFQTPRGFGHMPFVKEEFRNAGFEDAMRSSARKHLPVYESTNFYSYSKNHSNHLRNWFDFEKVLSFAELPVVPDLYGKELRGDLFRIKPWSLKRLARSLPVQAGGEYMLLADMRRIWDLPGRTYCTLTIGGETVEQRLENGPRFLPIPSRLIRDGSVEVVVESDAPLPADPVLEVFAVDETLDLPLGAGSKYWFYPLFSEGIVEDSGLKKDAAKLFDQGTMRVPRFVSPGRRGVAVFKVELFRGDPFFYQRHTMSLDSGGGAEEHVLPGRRRTDCLAVDLGSGDGELSLVPVHMKTSLPSYPEQRALKRQKVLTRKGGLGYVKLISVRLLSVPEELRERLIIDIGTADDGPWLEGGFHSYELSGERPVRWSGETGRIRLPRMVGPSVEVRVRTLEHRPEEYRRPPAFVFYSLEVPAERVQVHMAGENVVEYTFRADRSELPGHGGDLLEIRTPPWIPSGPSGKGDARRLGVMIDTVEVVPLEGPAGR